MLSIVMVILGVISVVLGLVGNAIIGTHLTLVGVVCILLAIYLQIRNLIKVLSKKD